MPDNSNMSSSQQIIVENRSKVRITGVTDVVNFDEFEVCMDTQQGELTVEGEGLHISLLSLETGDIHIDGTVSGIRYEDAGGGKKKSGLFRR